VRGRAIPTRLLSWPAGLAVSSLVLSALTAGLAPLLDESQVLPIVLLYLLVALVCAATWGYVVGLYAAASADLLVNFFFVPPLHTFFVHDPTSAVELLAFLAVAAVGASMLGRFRRQATLARSREVEANLLLEVNQAVAQAVTPPQALERLCAAVARVLGARGCSIIVAEGEWPVAARTSDLESEAMPTGNERSVIMEAIRRQAVLRHGQPPQQLVRVVRPRTSVVPVRTFVPFPREAAVPGALRIVGMFEAPPLVDGNRLLLGFASEASVALHRARLAEGAQRAQAYERADEFKSILLSSISHDLRSPLTAIKAAVDSLRDETVSWPPEDTRAFLDTIVAQTDRLSGIVADLLQMSRLEGGTVRVVLERVQVTPLLADAATTLRPLTAGRKVHIRAPDTLWVTADYGLLAQALGNLVENATRYSRARGAIELDAEAAGDFVRISVRDEGPGIPRDDLPRVFEKFYRGVQATQTKGTGLGLSIVKAMVELCGGTVTVRSSPAGTVFTMILPAAMPVTK